MDVDGLRSFLVLVLTCFSIGRNDVKQGNNTRDYLFKLFYFEYDFIVHLMNFFTEFQAVTVAVITFLPRRKLACTPVA